MHVHTFNKKSKIVRVWGSYSASVVTVQSGSGKIHSVVGAAGIWTKIMALLWLDAMRNHTIFFSIKRQNV